MSRIAVGTIISLLEFHNMTAPGDRLAGGR